MRSKSNEWKLNRQKMLERKEKMETHVKGNKETNDTDGIHLHLGCGLNILEGFVNIDKFCQDPKIKNRDMFQLNYFPNTVDTIYSSHSLEHLPIRHAKLALQNWYNYLKPGGKLCLAIPDIEETMLILLNLHPEDHLYEWYMHTLFGYQVDSNIGFHDKNLEHPVDMGQFHTCGFTQKSISCLLEKIGYKIEIIFKYDGYDTPSLWIEAVK